jgi:hypothetical protein
MSTIASLLFAQVSFTGVVYTTKKRRDAALFFCGAGNSHMIMKHDGAATLLFPTDSGQWSGPRTRAADMEQVVLWEMGESRQQYCCLVVKRGTEGVCFASDDG